MHYKIFRAAIPFLFLFTFHAGAQVNIERVEEVKELAKKGDVRAKYQLAQLYEEGKYEKQNLKRAFALYKDAADAQYDSAYFNLGRMYELGKGVLQNFSLAFAYYQKLEDVDHAEAAFRIAHLYEAGLGTEENRSKAVSMYLKALRLGHMPAQVKVDNLPIDSLADRKDISYIKYKADKGDLQSQFLVGRMYEEGAGFKKDLGKAYDYYLKSAEGDYTKAMIALGDMYAKGKHVKRNTRLATKYYLKAAANGDETAEKRLKTIDITNTLDPNSVDYLVYTANSGVAADQFKLYQKFFYGDGVPVDYDKALEYCQRSAANDYQPAIMTIANLYDKGIIVKRDPKSAFRYYRKAALLKNDSALFLIAEKYARGDGVQQDEARAVRYYLTAAINGIETAQFRLSAYNILRYVDQNDLRYVKYRALKGDTNAQLAAAKYHLRKNESEAVRWLRKAAEADVGEAQTLLGQVFYEGKCNMPRDNDEAQKWFAKAAQKKELAAFRYLADMYSKNLITSSNDNLEGAFQMANEYLTLKQGQLGKEDAVMYKIMGKIYMQREDYFNAIRYFSDYIKAYDESLDKPMDLIEALETRATAYHELKNYSSAVNDIDIALLQLEEYKEHADLKYEYKFIKGYLLINKAKAFFGEENYFKACNTIQSAIQLGVRVDDEYIKQCLRN
ncbi:MAG: SEL1-like repeat protein [Flammeovirgaceae bacterium]